MTNIFQSFEGDPYHGVLVLAFLHSNPGPVPTSTSPVHPDTNAPHPPGPDPCCEPTIVRFTELGASVFFILLILAPHPIRLKGTCLLTM